MVDHPHEYFTLAACMAGNFLAWYQVAKHGDIYLYLYLLARMGRYELGIEM